MQNSSALFIRVGGVLYDRTHTRLITHYRGIAQIMPVFSVMFFILCLANAGTLLTMNFVGEFLSHFSSSIPDVTRREFFVLIPLVGLTVLFGIYPSPILDGLDYSVSTLIYNYHSSDISPYYSMILMVYLFTGKYNAYKKNRVFDKE